MKKLCVLAAISLLIVFSSNAQGVALGIKGGLNMAKLSGDAITDASSRTGLHFGAYVRLKMGGVSLQPEAYYSVQGGEFSVGALKESIDAKYINIPVLLKFNPVPVFNFHFGPQFGLLMNAKNIDKVDIKSELKSSDLSAVVGAGLDLPFGLHFTVRYVKGLSEISDILAYKGKGSTFQVSVAYDLVKLGK